MAEVRVIPCLLLKDTGMVKTTRFGDPVYLGDAINIVKLFNDMEVDELGVLDISAAGRGRGPNFDLLASIASNAFMPLSYGGGISEIAEARKILQLGFEKIIIGTAAVSNPDLIGRAAEEFGSQSVVVSIDVRKKLFGRYEVCTAGGKRKTGKDPVAHAEEMASRGAGEILLTSVDRDGTMSGYDLELIRMVCDAVEIPVIASGGAGHVNHFAEAVHKGGASAVAAASSFVFHGRRKAVLVNFPDREELQKVLNPPGTSG